MSESAAPKAARSAAELLNFTEISLKEGIYTEKKCGCRGSKGKNYIPGRITLDLNGKEVSNRELACRSCAYKKRGDTLSCLIFEQSRRTCLPEANVKNTFRTAAAFRAKRAAAEAAANAANADEHEKAFAWTP